MKSSKDEKTDGMTASVAEERLKAMAQAIDSQSKDIGEKSSNLNKEEPLQKIDDYNQAPLPSSSKLPASRDPLSSFQQMETLQSVHTLNSSQMKLENDNTIAIRKSGELNI